MLPDLSTASSNGSDIEIGADQIAGAESPARLKDTLTYISSDDRKTWVNFGIAIKHDFGDAGLKTWLEWSRRSPKFQLDEALEAWESFKYETSGPKITVSSIFYMARERGWTDRRDAPELPEYITRLNTGYFIASLGGKTLIFNEGLDPRDGARRSRR